jgi:hypothetical protein
MFDVRAMHSGNIPSSILILSHPVSTTISTPPPTAITNHRLMPERLDSLLRLCPVLI